VPLDGDQVTDAENHRRGRSRRGRGSEKYGVNTVVNYRSAATPARTFEDLLTHALTDADHAAGSAVYMLGEPTAPFPGTARHLRQGKGIEIVHGEYVGNSQFHS
jgi:hypothetical protein